MNCCSVLKDGMYPKDFEGTVDGAHPNDLGMTYLAESYGKAVAQALSGRALRQARQIRCNK